MIKSGKHLDGSELTAQAIFRIDQKEKAMSPNKTPSKSAKDQLKTEGITLGRMPGWFYDVFVSLLSHGKEAKMREEILDLANIQPGDKICDVGTGTGTLAILAAERALLGTKATEGSDIDEKKEVAVNHEGLVVGLDPCLHLLKRAEKKATKYFKKEHHEHAPTNLIWKHGLAEDIPADDNTFDVVMCTFTLHHLPGEEFQAQCLVEMMRILHPGGMILIVDFAGGHHGHHHGKKQQVADDIQNDPAKVAIERAKFQNVRIQKVAMMGAVAITATKPSGGHDETRNMSKGQVITSLESNIAMGEEDSKDNAPTKGQILANLDSDLIMGQRDDDEAHKKMSKGEYLANLPSNVM